MSAHRRPHLWGRIAGTIAILFGILTVREGGAVLLGDDEAVRAAGHYVPFVLWFNTVAGFAYIGAGFGLWLLRRWAASLSFVIAALSLAVLFALGVHIAVGGAYELRTLIAMTMRSAVWIAISAVAYRYIWHPQVMYGIRR
ncbi:MAG: hypothetical protein ACOC9Q_00915 [bacterium]